MRYARKSSSLIHFMTLGKSSGSDYELGGILSTFCFHCLVKYDTVTERNGFARNLGTSLAQVGLLSLRLLSVVVTHVSRMLLALSYQNQIVLYVTRKLRHQLIFVSKQCLGRTVLAKTVYPKIISRKTDISHLAEIYRLFPRRITAGFVFPICNSVGVFLRIVNSIMSQVYIQAHHVVLLNSLTKCALVTRNAQEK